MDILYIIIIGMTLSAMSMCYQGKKNIDKEEYKPEKVIKYLYISSILFGSLGIFIGTNLFNYLVDNKKFVIFNAIMLVIQTFIFIAVISIL